MENIIDRKLNELRATMPGMTEEKREAAMEIILNYGTCCLCEAGQEEVEEAAQRMDAELEALYGDS